MSTPTDLIIPAESIQWGPYSLPGFAGDYEAAIVNTDVTKAPFIALLRMKPGARILRHYHPLLREAVYVMEGEMLNEGSERLPAGSFLVHGPGVEHGPHEAPQGCTVMFIQYPTEVGADGQYVVGPDDSVFAE